MATKGIPALEKSILKAKGVTAPQLKKLESAGVRSRADLITIGDAGTLVEISGLSPKVAARVMAWATGAREPQANVVVESADTVLCGYCGAKQPKDYKTGDLCTACGRQAEPTLACYWCGASGPGKFCRACGATLVATGELELAVQLKRDGLAKDQIPARLAALTPAEREALWGRVRRR